MSTFTNLFFSGLYNLMGYTFYHILEVSYCVIQILMQTVRPLLLLSFIIIIISNRTRLYFVILHNNVEKIFDRH